jgi:hypothetical protein
MTAARVRRRRWRDLPGAERRALVTMLWLVPVMHVAVRVWNYRRVRDIIDRRRGKATDTSAAVVEAWRLATSRVQAYSWLPGNCLSRSLALYYSLRAEDHDPALRLGVSLDSNVFAAHAWVELGGRVLNDTANVGERYRPLEPASRLPGQL